MTQMHLSTNQKQTHRCQGPAAAWVGGGEGRTGSLGLADVSYYIQTGSATRSCCMAQSLSQDVFNIL